MTSLSSWRHGPVLAGAAGLLYACSMASHYSPPSLTPVAQGNPIAIYRFSDARGRPSPTAIGSYIQASGRADYSYDAQPVATTITDAFAKALKARGFRVVDVSSTEFAPGQPSAGAPLAVSGVILNFWMERGWRVLGTTGICQILLRAHEPNGRLLFEKVYSKPFSTSGGVAAIRVYKVMAGLLRETVEQAMNDPELLRQLISGQGAEIDWNLLGRARASGSRARRRPGAPFRTASS